MNPLDWPMIAGPLPVIMLISARLALAWLAAGRNASAGTRPGSPGLTRSSCWRGHGFRAAPGLS